MGIESILGAVAGPLIGGLMGGDEGGDGGGGQQQSTASKSEPWAPAQPYILDNLKDTKKLQDFYRKTPFNPQQQTSYQNLFGDLDNFRQNIAPGLMGFANKAMTSNYQRQRGGAPGSGGGYGGPVQPGGLMQSGQQGPFSAPQGKAYGLLDFNAQNPYTNGGITADAPVEKAPEAAPVVAKTFQEQMDEYTRNRPADSEYYLRGGR